MNYEQAEQEALRMANAARLKSQMRDNESVNNQKIVKVKKTNKKVLLSIGLLSLAGILSLGYIQAKSRLKGDKVESTTGYVTQGTNLNPTVTEVIEEMFNINGR